MGDQKSDGEIPGREPGTASSVSAATMATPQEATLSPAAEGEGASPAPPVVPPRPTLSRSPEGSMGSISSGGVPPVPPPRRGSGAANLPSKAPPPPPPRRGSTIDPLTPPDIQRLRRPSDHHALMVDAPVRQQHLDDPRPPMGLAEARGSRGSLLPTASSNVSAGAAPSPPVSRAANATRALVLAILALLVLEGAAVADMGRQDFVQSAYGLAAIIASAACVLVHLWALVALLPLVRPHGISARAQGLSARMWPLLPVLGVTFVAMAATAVQAVLWRGISWLFLAPAAHLPALWLAVRAYSALKTVEVRVARRPAVDTSVQSPTNQRAASPGAAVPPGAPPMQEPGRRVSQQPQMSAVRPPPTLPGRGSTVAIPRPGQSPVAAVVMQRSASMSELTSAATTL